MNTDEGLVIQTHGLSKTYRGVAALSSLDLCVPRHSIFALLGPNGAGKSTTIRLLLGLIRPSSGSGTIFGSDLVRHTLAIRQRIGYLAQDPRFYDEMTPRELLRFVAHFFYTGPRASIEKRIAEVLELVGLGEKANRRIKGFSGGEQQRLGIAQATINHPDLLILDEPAAALDPLGRRDVLEVMQRLRQTTTIFYSTHLLDDVERVSDTVAILNQGKLMVQAPLNTLVEGAGEATYEITWCGNGQAAYQRISSLPWVKQMTQFLEPEQVRWRITVQDVALAQAHLLPLMLEDGQVQILAFGRKKQTLEDLFVGFVEGGNRYDQ